MRDKIINPRHLLPRSFGVQSGFQASHSGSARQPGQLGLKLRCVESPFSSWDKCDFIFIVIVLGGEGHFVRYLLNVGPL